MTVLIQCAKCGVKLGSLYIEQNANNEQAICAVKHPCPAVGLHDASDIAIVINPTELTSTGEVKPRG